MNCFKHPETPAVGICKFCQKGLCMECAHDLGHGLACREHLREVNDLQAVFLAQAPSFKKVTAMILDVVFIGLGIYFSIIAIMEMSEPSSNSWMGLGVGISFVLLGVAFAWMRLSSNKR